MPYYLYILFVFFVSGFAQANPQKPQLSLNDIKWPPYFLPRLESPHYQGIAKEILNTCIASDKYDIRYKTLPIKRTHIYMQSGELDISVYSFKSSREKFVVYGKEPLFISEYGFATRRADNIVINQLSDITSYKFGDLSGLSHTPELNEIINKKRKNNQVSNGYDLDAMFGQMLATPQRFEVMANSKETLKWRAKQLEISNQVTIHDLTIKFKPYFVTVSKSSKNIEDITAFLDIIDQCIIDLKTSGEYQRINAKYGL